MKRWNSLKHMQHFDAFHSNQTKEKEKKRKNIFSLQLFGTHATLQDTLEIKEFVLKIFFFNWDSIHARLNSHYVA